ncbi:NAD(P)-dependent oxidoreductase [Cupriavidus sp. AcVe19-6a]|uniref:NAD(P)-dependent oxidoreductase n=1 Tax=Cupriavidus sp. AcVe19-6a TaxID=2821358 RepID=UPI001AE1EAD8|nr:NAD(P)-dependent oxidoreductase [Cupriavidus sp. AcVe19-6a]MBP0638003.1 NAD(P)-dependent oxidoreductase [Cupriavidus sp. AcVe19-6a]
MKVNFIGLGAIGLPMALQIRNAGHTVGGLDVVPAACANAQAQNIEAVNRVSDLPTADVAVVMVATPDQLAKLVDDAIDKPIATTWVIMSTVGPASVREQGERLRAAGVRVVDAPVTGGVARARTGQLVIFAAGNATDIEAVRPVLQTMGEVRVTGEKLGDGQAIKVVNQHLCSVHIVAAAEALNLARSLGLDPAQVLGLIEKGAAGSWMLSDRGPRMLKGTDVEVTSSINIFVKDSGLVVDAAQGCGADVPLLDLAHARYCQAAQAGLGQRDDSRVIETWQK